MLPMQYTSCCKNFLAAVTLSNVSFATCSLWASFPVPPSFLSIICKMYVYMFMLILGNIIERECIEKRRSWSIQHQCNLHNNTSCLIFFFIFIFFNTFPFFMLWASNALMLMKGLLLLPQVKIYWKLMISNLLLHYISSYRACHINNLEMCMISETIRITLYFT